MVRCIGGGYEPTLNESRKSVLTQLEPAARRPECERSSGMPMGPLRWHPFDPISKHDPQPWTNATVSYCPEVMGRCCCTACLSVQVRPASQGGKLSSRQQSHGTHPGRPRHGGHHGTTGTRIRQRCRHGDRVSRPITGKDTRSSILCVRDRDGDLMEGSRKPPRWRASRLGNGVICTTRITFRRSHGDDFTRTSRSTSGRRLAPRGVG